MLQAPTEEQEWLEIAKSFEDTWQFPHCLGAIDGKHINVQCPFNSNSEHYNYKGTFSIVLLALVDSNYCFTYADIGCQGRISDGGVFRNSTPYQKIYGENSTLPRATRIGNYKDLPLPYVFVADDAFGLTTRLLKPYPGIHKKGSFQRIFNYRLSRCRMVVEDAFGILASIFRILRKPMLLQPEKATLITLTCVLLHNFLRRSKTSRNMYSPQGCFDSYSEEGEFRPGSWRENSQELTSMLPLQRHPRNSSQDAQTLRNEFANYFCTTGKIEWQNNY